MIVGDLGLLGEATCNPDVRAPGYNDRLWSKLVRNTIDARGDGAGSPLGFGEFGLVIDADKKSCGVEAAAHFKVGLDEPKNKGDAEDEESSDEDGEQALQELLDASAEEASKKKDLHREEVRDLERGRQHQGPEATGARTFDNPTGRTWDCCSQRKIVFARKGWPASFWQQPWQSHRRSADATTAR